MELATLYFLCKINQKMVDSISECVIIKLTQNWLTPDWAKGKDIYEGKTRGILARPKARKQPNAKADGRRTRSIIRISVGSRERKEEYAGEMVRFSL